MWNLSQYVVHWGLTLMASVQITPQKRKLVHLVFGRFLRPNVPFFVFVPLLAQEPSNLGPKEAELPLRLTNVIMLSFNISFQYRYFISSGHSFTHQKINVLPPSCKTDIKIWTFVSVPSHLPNIYSCPEVWFWWPLPYDFILLQSQVHFQQTAFVSKGPLGITLIEFYMITFVPV